MRIAHVTAVVVLMACGEASGLPSSALFEVDVAGETFRVRVETTEQIAQLEARRAAGAPGVIMGSLKAGDGGFNQPWSWHLDPATVETPDMAIELCDGRPTHVEQDLEQWLNVVKSFCPWGATVVRRLE